MPTGDFKSQHDTDCSEPPKELDEFVDQSPSKNEINWSDLVNMGQSSL